MGKCDKRVKVKDFASLYSNDKRLVAFWQETRLSSMGHEEDVILEPYFEWEGANMATAGGSFVSYFYFCFPIIYDLGELIPFTQF